MEQAKEIMKIIIPPTCRKKTKLNKISCISINIFIVYHKLNKIPKFLENISMTAFKNPDKSVIIILTFIIKDVRNR